MIEDLEALANSLPVPGRDEKPPDRGILTDEQVKDIRAKKKGKRTRHDWSNPAELMMRRVLEGAFDAANVRREADRAQGYQDAEGVWHFNYANFGKPDITFAAVYRGKLLGGVMEVKSVAPTSSSLGLANIKKHQIKAMDKAKGIRLWGLVFWEGKGQARCFVVDHQAFMRIIRVELAGRADKNFKGRSLRRKKDLDLLVGCEVLKTNRWYLPEGHWFND